MEQRRLADPSLVVLIGPSGSGKSTWAAAYFAADQVVSADRLRGMVGEGEHDLSASADAFDLLDRIVEARIRRRLSTVIDTLGLDGKRRGRWRDLAARQDVPCVAVAFDTPAAECRRRNSWREYRVPASVLSTQLTAFAQLRAGLDVEGFAEVIAPRPVRLVTPSVADAARAVRAVRAASDGSALGGDGPLRFGLQVSSFTLPGGPVELPARLADLARAAEDAGFSSIWVMDHLRQIPQVGRPWEDLPESLTTLGYLAAATRTASVGCLVSCITLRNLPLLGKALATIDVLSGGRARCGLGAGWFAAEHAAYGIPFPTAAARLDLLEDALQLLPLLWGKGAPAFEGRTISVPEALCYPRPLAGRIPILLGGSGERRTLRLVAQYADACNLMGEPEMVRHKLGVLHRHCADLDRDPASVEVTHLSTALVARDAGDLDAELTRRRPARNAARWSARTNPGTVSDQVLRFRALQDAGVQHAIVSLEGVWDSPAVERFAEVIAAFR